jgi:hypothetical protein
MLPLSYIIKKLLLPDTLVFTIDIIIGTFIYLSFIFYISKHYKNYDVIKTVREVIKGL